MDILKGTINDAGKTVSSAITQEQNAVKDIIDHAFAQVRSLLNDYKITLIFEKVK